MGISFESLVHIFSWYVMHHGYGAVLHVSIFKVLLFVIDKSESLGQTIDNTY